MIKRNGDALLICFHATMTAAGAHVEIGSRRLSGVCWVPPEAKGVVVFAHGSGSSQHSARNLAVAERLLGVGFATLTFDLLTEYEAQHREHVIDIQLLTARLVEAIDWVAAEPLTDHLPIGMFGSSTGAAAAIGAAVQRLDAVSAIVSRGGRVDLAGPAVEALRVPTLLIAAGKDEPVLFLNRQAVRSIPAEAALVVTPGVSHLFREPGALERVIDETVAWFSKHIRAGAV